MAEGKILDGKDKNKNLWIHYFVFPNAKCLLSSTFLRFAGSCFKALKTSTKTFGKAAQAPAPLSSLVKITL
ncbi:hypothetical protein QUB05_23440 [Microcoleus sp. F10-C6]|uniref:hypothetical protein n=1 Tax=unclassified Microcoleus TaxID=2642155 RepID=UPI002FD11D26